MISTGSDVADRLVKEVEYAKVCIPHYWIIERDAGNPVHRPTLNTETGEYSAVSGSAQPLAWLLTTTPDLG